jgi:hypothetical protein
MKGFVLAQCEACNGTGIYHGFAEPKGVGVVCLGCKGTGGVKLEYVPWTHRKLRRDIKTVRCSRGTFIVTGVGPIGGTVTYQQFLDGKMPILAGARERQ